MKKRDNEIENFEFSSCPAIYKLLKKKTESSWKSFELYTAYPGVLIGTGNPHEISMENAIKCGFSFDYVTGLPYIPGSSIKGMLRSYFPKEGSADEQEKQAYITEVLKNTYVKLQTVVTTQAEDITSKEKELSDLKADNDAYYNTTVASEDLEAVKEAAQNRLGMKYADESQVIYFDDSENSYVRQYQDVPDAK